MEAVVTEVEPAKAKATRMRFLTQEEYDLMVSYLQNPGTTIARIPVPKRRAWVRASQAYRYKEGTLYKLKKSKGIVTALHYVEPSKKKGVIERIHTKLMVHGGWHRTYSAVSSQT